MKLIILGSGTSHGIPVLGCDCAVCKSADPRDKRMRASIYIESSGHAAVIDTGPEFRLQALAAGIKKLDAVFLTHTHADHIHGLDDVRPLSEDKPIPVYCDRHAIIELKERFSYVFKTTQEGGGKPRIVPVEVSTPVIIGNMRFTPIPVKHGALDILGWRIDDIENSASAIVYLTDTSAIPESSLPLIGSPQILIIGGLRSRPHKTHFTFDQALHTALNLKVKKAFLTHICHDYSHKELEEYCGNFIKELTTSPQGEVSSVRELSGISMAPAWDGLTL